MSLAWIGLLAGVLFLIAYWLYGGFLTRFFRLEPSLRTPAWEQRDDVDFVPTDPRYLISQHFAAIAAAGPIVGPILAGMMFGWVPALLWIVLGAILIGGVHDMGALVASVRHKARSIAEVVREHMTPRSYLLFLGFIWLALVYIIVAFTDLVAASFVGRQTLESGETVLGGGIATSSVLYLLLPIGMGLLLRYTKIGLLPLTVLFLPLVVVAIVVGQYFPIEFSALLGSEAAARKVWGVLILLYCVVAALLPMWLLLQPRGYLGGLFLFSFLVVGLYGLFFGGKTLQYPAFRGWDFGGQTLFPFLFITVACGACSGFHSLIASGTTSKQLRKETDARFVGYGAMLMEGMVAVIALATVMMLAPNSPLVAGGEPKPNYIFASGIGSFLQENFGVPAVIAVSVMLMAFTTFVYDTLDVCTRLGRYVLQELFGWKGRGGAWLATGATVGLPLLYLLFAPSDGRPLWQVFWGLFGASNQLLAGLTLLGLTVWLWRRYRKAWAFVITGLPFVWMFTMSTWSLVKTVMGEIQKAHGLNPVFWVAVVLIGLAGLMLIEGVRSLFGERPPAEPAPAPAS
jgi:carbon starvation protein